MAQAMPDAGQDRMPDSDAKDGGDAQQAPAAPNPISSDHFRRAAGQFVTGVTIVTTRLDGAPRGMTANSFASVSLDPPLILWNVGKASDSYQAFTQCDAFAVHVLSRQQEQLARLFATRGADRFAGLDFRAGLNGIPLLNDCLTVFECRVAHHHAGGD
ncbi:MAG: flavin reductase family protein, partial [Pseudomonadota bacterium]